jgi:hypothetical protein
MNAKELWDHDPLFDYQDRYMDAQTPGEWTRCWDDFTEEMWDTYRDEFGRDDLELWGVPADQQIHLGWRVNNITLPISTTWTVSYQGTAGDDISPITGIISTTRTYSLTGLTNYEWYTITLTGVVTDTEILSDTVMVMPTDLSLYLPLIQNER